MMSAKIYFCYRFEDFRYLRLKGFIKEIVFIDFENYLILV
jgi:hypothetical protein